jgi:hypothetical protein
VSKARKCSSDCFVLSNVEDREGTGVGAACHVLLLPSLYVTGQENTRRGVGEEDGHRVIVGLGEQLAWQRGDDVGSNLI